MLNKTLLFASKRDYTLIYRLGAHKDLRYGYDSSEFGQVLYDNVEANTSPDKHWKAFRWFDYYSDSNLTTIALEDIGVGIMPASPECARKQQ